MSASVSNCCARVTGFLHPLKQSDRLGGPHPRFHDDGRFANNSCRAFFWGTFVKRILLSTVAVFAFAAVGHADELSDIQAQSKQLREQNQALTKRLADLEKRQQKLEKQQPTVQAQAGARAANPADAMAADLPYKAAVKAPAPINDDLCWHGICLYGNFDMGLAYMQHGAPSSPMIGQIEPVEKNSNGSYFGV